MDDAARIEKLVKQAAETSRLMGVDFVPVYRRLGSGVHTPTSGEVRANGERGSDGAAGAPAKARIVDGDIGGLAAHGAPVDAVTEKARLAERAEVSRPVAVGGALFGGTGGVAEEDQNGGDGESAMRRARRTPVTAEVRAERQTRLDEIRARYEKDAPHQHFKTDHHTIVFGEGDPAARLMFVGEAPGEEEDKTGRPFVGRAGQLLNKMIGAMGLKREDVYIANVLKTRPPGNATPTSEEARLCWPYLQDQIATVAPEVIVTLGLPASRLLLETQESMGNLRGRWASLRVKDLEVAVMPTYHPAYLLRSYTAENRARVWDDLQKVMERLGIKGGAGKGVE